MTREVNDGVVVECDVCGGAMDDDGCTVGDEVVFCDNGDAGIFIATDGWGQIGNYVACPDCVAKINRGEVALKFEEKGSRKMSKAKYETVADIAAEMRAVARENGFAQSDRADRIEAAEKREVADLIAADERLQSAARAVENRETGKPKRMHTP